MAMTRRSIVASMPADPGEIWLLSQTMRIPPTAAINAAKVWAALDGRGFVIPDDVIALLVPVFAHRLIPSRVAGAARARTAGDSVVAALEHIAGSVRVPLAARA